MLVPTFRNISYPHFTPRLILVPTFFLCTHTFYDKDGTNAIGHRIHIPLDTPSDLSLALISLPVAQIIERLPEFHTDQSASLLTHSTGKRILSLSIPSNSHPVVIAY